VASYPNPLENNDLLVLIVAPRGRDAVLIHDLLTKTDIGCQKCADVEVATQKMIAGAGASIVADEALSIAQIGMLSKVIEAQPRWSDFPLIVLTASGAASSNTERAMKMRTPLGNVLLLERPIRPETLVSAVQGALRSRRRQYQIRDHQEELRKSEARLRLSEERLRLAQRAAKIGSWELDLDTYEYIWSHEVFEILGRTEGSYPPTQADFLSLMYFSADRENAEKALKTATTTHKEYKTNFRIRRLDGQFRWVSARGMPYYNQGKNLILGVFIDVTDAREPINSVATLGKRPSSPHQRKSKRRI
jgi:PAS domain S-box-containing protein